MFQVCEVVFNHVLAVLCIPSVNDFKVKHFKEYSIRIDSHQYN